MTRFALAVLALASGVYTYLGVRGLLDGSATFVFFAAIIYSAAVSVAIYAFWTFMLRFVPLVTNTGQRVGLFLTMAVGCFMIMAMSSWLNAAALAGSAALEQHLAVNLEGYVADLDQAHANALAANRCCPTCSAPPIASAALPMTSAVPARSPAPPARARWCSC